MTKVLYDDNCMLCRSLAHWARTRAGATMEFVSWQVYYENETAVPTVLRVLSGDRTLDGPDAWAFLLAHFPDLVALNWVAERLQIRPGVARALHAVGSASRRLCRGCGEKPWSGSRHSKNI